MRKTAPKAKPQETDWPGRVQVYTGDGKGKTTAALGLALRGAGAGLPVLVIQFMKGREAAELAALARLGIRVRRFGSGRWVGRPPAAGEILLARRGFAAAAAALRAGRHRIVILDEACCAVRAGLLRPSDLLALLRLRRPATELVLTGRGAPASLLRAADLVTEMREVKHYFRRGVPARKGIEH